MKKIYGMIAIAVFAAMLLLPTLIWGALVAIGGDEFVKAEIVEPIESEEGENRRIKTFADVLKGKTLEDGTVEEFDFNDLTGNIEALYNDYAPFRNSLVAVQGKMISAIEMPYKEKIEPALVELLYSNKNKENGQQQVQQDTTAPDIGDIFGPSTDTTEEEDPYIPPPDAEIIGGDADCNHSFGDAVEENAATCTEHGSTLADCSKCGAKLREYTEALGHDYEELDGVKATCTSGGYSHQKCSRCEEEKNLTYAVLAHSGRKIKTVEASYLDCGYTLKKCIDCGREYRDDIVPKLIDTSIYPVSYNGNKKVIYGRYDWLFYTGDNMEKRYVGEMMMTEKEMQQLTNALDSLNLKLKEYGVTLVIALWPNKCDVYGEYMPTYGDIADIKTSEVLINYINEHKETDFVAIYPLAEMMAAKNYYQTYYKFDTHWNAAGGFMGAQAIYKAIGMETTDIRTLKATPTSARLRDIIKTMLSSSEQKKYATIEDTEYLFEYRPEVTVTSETGSGAGKDWFASADELYTTSDSKNDKSLVFLGDSYRNAIAPYLKKDFSKAMFAHANNVTQYAKDIMECDVFVIARVSRLDKSLLNIVRDAKDMIVLLEKQEASK